MATEVIQAQLDLEQVCRELFARLGQQPASALESVLDQLAKLKGQERWTDETKLINLFARATLCLVGSELGQTTTNPVDELFSPQLRQSDRQAIAMCLARLVTDFPDAITRQDLNTRMIGLFDEQFPDTIYRVGRVNAADQAFKKYTEIASVVSRTFDDIREAVGRVIDIEDLTQFKANYLKRINSSVARLVFHPFVPAAVREERVIHLMACITAYKGSNGPELLSAYQRVQVDAATLKSDAVTSGTMSSALISGLADKLCHLVTEDFLRTPFSKHAELRVEGTDKKYPLGTPGASFSLAVNLTNDGPGYAFDVVVRIKSWTDGFEIGQLQHDLGGIEPSQIVVEFPVHILEGTDEAMVDFEVSWRNFDDTKSTSSFLLEAKPQRAGINWDTAGTEDPYSLSPVLTAKTLVGRTDILNRLLALTKGPTVESSFIRGQKRVGKTSIVKALQNRLFELFPKDYTVVYLEAGDYIGHDGKHTVEMLGGSICKAVRNSDPRFTSLTTPNFAAGLAPLNGFLQDALVLNPACRMLFILDEFDELPLELYRRGLIGDAFFKTVRSVSNKEQFGFVLVGGEKMEYVLSCQGDALNKFERFSVDYFDKQQYWNDFVELVRRPAAEYLDFSTPAVLGIYDASAGNPYFAKLICRSLFVLMVKNRDSYVSPAEVREAVKNTLMEIGGNSFAHFWLDAICEPAPRAEEISIFRRKALLSLAECMRAGQCGGRGAKKDQIIEAARSFSLSEMQVEAELREFERRAVIEVKGSCYTPKVDLFGRWLVQKGYQEMITAFMDADALIALKQREEQERIRDEELLQLVNGWGLFLGQRVGVEQVRAWLAQFKGVSDQRVAFKILQAINFYSGDRIRERMREIHGIVTRRIVWQRKALQPKRRDLVVSALGGLAHSGAEYARRYADENQIYPDNVVDLTDIAGVLKKRADEVKAVIFVDDFIGTGHTLSKAISRLPDETKKAIEDCRVPVLLLVVAGFARGIHHVESAILSHCPRISLHVCDVFEDGDMLFSNSSRVFPDAVERLRAKDMAHEYGVELVPNAPFGYGGCEAAVVFENKIPNNCLPVLWQETGKWKPLFKRT